MLLSFPKAGSLRSTSVSFSRTISFLKNMEIVPVLPVALLQKSGRNVAFVFLELLFSKIINLPNLKAFHVLLHPRHWNSQPKCLSVFPSDCRNHGFSSILPWLTSLLFLSLIINWPLVLRCVICLWPLCSAPGGRRTALMPCPWLPGYWSPLLLVSAFTFPFPKHCHPPISSFPILLVVIIFIYSQAYSWHVDKLQLVQREAFCI